ncbi:MAG: DUF4286 family protein [Sediminibacterium sp.]|jgi:hypothetical protein
MQVHNISFQLHPTIVSSWLDWMKNDFLPCIKDTGCFSEEKLYQIEVPSDQNPTYTLQLFAVSREHINKYQSQFADTIILQVHNKWGEQCLYFTTNMEIVN